MKKCSKCKVEKEFTDFSKNRSRKDGLHHQCKSCVKDYYEANKEDIAAYSKAHFEANREKRKEQKKEYQRNRRKSDPLYKLKDNLRSRTSAAFRAGGYSKSSKTQEMLGVNWGVVSAHIERQFTKGMNWENQGEWQIDHIIPLSSANTEEELKKLCHYSNLQPLWAEENLSKSDSVNGQQIKFRI